MTSSNDDPGYELVTVQSGDRSLRSLACGETFHPVVGPMAEANALHAQGQRLVERTAKHDGAFVIWDVGLGAGANTIAALEALSGAPGRIEIYSFDLTLAPLAFAQAHAGELGYVVPWQKPIASLLSAGEWKSHGGLRSWKVLLGDFRERLADAPPPHAVFYDPYSARTNPELWTLEHFTALRAQLTAESGCMVTSYTRSTALRVSLMLAGFFVGLGGATGEKDQTTIAATRLDLLELPLAKDWLARVGRSTRGAPPRAADAEGRPINTADWAALNAHRQFREVG